MYPPSANDSVELTAARVEIQQYLGNWLRQPWLNMDYVKHALFIVSLVLFAFKYRASYYEQLEFDERVRQAYAEARRKYHTSPYEMFVLPMTPPDVDDNAPNI